MADFPAGASADAQNAQVPNQQLGVTAPTGTSYVDQQWKDLIKRGDHKVHGLSLNRDVTAVVTTDPF